MLQQSSTTDSSEKRTTKKLPFCMSHGLPDDRLHELFDQSFPSEDDYIDIFKKGNFITIFSFVIQNSQLFQCSCCQYILYT